MANAEDVLNLKIKISDFIKKNTPKGAKYPHGGSWSMWNSFDLSKDETDILFSEKSFSKFLHNKTGTPYAFRAVVLHAISLHPDLSIKILESDGKSPLFPFKNVVISTGLYSKEIDPNIFKDYDHIAKSEYLRICPTDMVERFLKDPSDKVRIAAYNRMGMLSCAEQMTKDKSAKVRTAICQVLPYGHPALENLIHDRSKWVFYSVLKKVDKSKIPMMLGSRHLKDGFINSVLKKRMSNLGET